MSLQTRIVALATAIGTDIKALFSQSIPAGGSTGQILSKTSAADYDTQWVVPSGGSGTQQVFVQPLAPTVTPGTPYFWYQTGLGPEGQDTTLWVEDGQ